MSHEEEIQDVVDKIHKCLVGDKLEGQIGLIDKVDKVDRRLSIIENKMAEKKSFKLPSWIMKMFGF